MKIFDVDLPSDFSYLSKIPTQIVRVEGKDDDH